MQDFRELSVWNKSHQLVLLLYQLTSDVPDRKFPGLASQIRRSAASIPANIAEGCGHRSQAELRKVSEHCLGVVVRACTTTSSSATISAYSPGPTTRVSMRGPSR